jgi:MFS superfamily sulfate permease-like transporter
MIALVEGYRAGLFALSQWMPNIVAGLIVGIAGLQIATLMASLILLVMGLAKMGRLIQFIPTPVVIGFTIGIGVIIFVGQWAYFLGVPKPEGEHFHEKVWSLLQSLPQTHWPTVLIALLSLVIESLLSAVVTLVLTVFVDLVVAVSVGVMLVIFHFLRRMAASVDTHEVADDALEKEFAGEQGLKRPDGVMIYEIDGPMFLRRLKTLSVRSSILPPILKRSWFVCGASRLSTRQGFNLSKRLFWICTVGVFRSYYAKQMQRF